MTIDRIEGDYVVVELESLEMVDVPLEIFPKGIREGDILEFRRLEDETEERKERIEDKFQHLFKKRENLE